MTLQEIFDASVSFIIAQGRPSRQEGDKGFCMYVNPTGDRCAAGAVIPTKFDSLFKERFLTEGADSAIFVYEFHSFDELLDQAVFAGDTEFANWIRDEISEEGRSLLVALQSAHDNAYDDRFLRDFAESAEDIAVYFKLNTDVISSHLITGTQ